MTRRILLGTTALLFPFSALAADNATLITPCSTGCVTVRSVEVTTGIYAPMTVLGSITGTPLATAAGTPNTTSVLSVQGTTNGTTMTVQGTGAASAAVTGNPFRAGLSDGTNTQNWLSALALADGVNGNNTGAVAPWVWNGTTWDRMPGSAANGIKAIVTNAGTFAVQASGTVTANAGTNLNTSLLALETGGNLATIAGIITSARAAVNPISGQVGVQGGAGASTALTQRVAIATDANAVTATLGAETTKVIGTINQGTSPWVVSNGGTFAVQATLGAETTKVIGTTRTLGNGGGVLDAVVGATYPANALAVGVLNGANIGRLIGDETSGLWVNIKAGAGSGGTALADGAGSTFTQGTTSVTPAACLFTSSVTNLTTGQAGIVRCTNDRQMLASVTAASGAFASGSFASGSHASGSFATGAFASGSYASGAYALGAIASGAIVDLGQQSDAAWVSGSGSLIAISKTIAGNPARTALNATAFNTNTYTTGQTNPLNADVNGNLYVSAGLNRINGVAVLTGNGATGTGSPRVTIANDNTPIPAKIDQTTPGTTNAIAIASINAATALTGNGGTGTGSLRVTIANDNTAFAVNAASTLAAETTKVIGTVRNLGNAGGITDFAGQNAASPASAWLTGCQFNTTPTTITTGNASPCQIDNAGNLLVKVSNATTALVGNADGVTPASSAANSPVNGYLYALNPAGNYDRLHATKGQLNVVNGGSTYQHIAASQTAAVLQTSTGAAGDYLSHCVIYPSTTAAGSVTVFDNTNAAGTNVIEFTTGTLSNLAPIPIPVGAVSSSGAWKVTTGANETVVCYGKFS